MLHHTRCSHCWRRGPCGADHGGQDRFYDLHRHTGHDATGWAGCKGMTASGLAAPCALRNDVCYLGVLQVLGPRGLMPNPKLGTITTNVGEAVDVRGLMRGERWLSLTCCCRCRGVLVFTECLARPVRVPHGEAGHCALPHWQGSLRGVGCEKRVPTCPAAGKLGANQAA